MQVDPESAPLIVRPRRAKLHGLWNEITVVEFAMRLCSLPNAAAVGAAAGAGASSRYAPAALACTRQVGPKLLFIYVTGA
jgi:hypothetical protein